MQQRNEENSRGVRLGVIVPSINIVMESWANQVLPAGVSLHAARMLMPDALTPDGIKLMDATDGHRAVGQIATCRPHAMAYGCTASSIVQGVAYDQHLREEMTTQTGIPSTTAAHAIMTAAATLGAKTVAVVSPYTAEIDKAEHRYFEAAGLTVVGGAYLGITDNFKLAEPTPEMLFKLGTDGWDQRADALIISCLNTPSHTVIDRLEEKLGKPVITSTQATLWHLLRLAGVNDKIRGYGRLLTEH